MRCVQAFAVSSAGLALVVAVSVGFTARAQSTGQGGGAPGAGEPPASFVHRLFEQYQSESGMDAVNKDFLDPAFAKLMRVNSQLFGKEGEADLDYDPVCQCQDFGGEYVFVGGNSAPDGIFVARMRSGDTKWRLTLKRIGGVWKVYDVVDAAGSVRARLLRDNACARRYVRAHKPIADACGS